MGLICGLALTMWIGFGGPKPPPPYLPVSTEGCNSTITHSTFYTDVPDNRLMFFINYV